MAGLRQGVTGEHKEAEGGETPSALRIDTDAFRALTARAGESGDPPIVGWFDCWRSNGTS
ncbi:hypothetical protein [Haloarcula salinisoli]|uniref:Uncharacterized protein n=1 Tax=Haloarcula salinisoli TaxID=2487746 RepID=A0A8J7YHK8_9EURY|nr:hypothetical protein [Halomicroarcula salinisoli]MBX0284919.1 hypothetical protein [Halomicroarcula salinisoli]MBX0303603.1 hypothetical protein [Halomicroarcula salinisoli]